MDDRNAMPRWTRSSQRGLTHWKRSSRGKSPRLAALDAKFTTRIDALEEKFEARFAEHDARFARIDRTLTLHSWMLGLILLVSVVPELKSLLA